MFMPARDVLSQTALAAGQRFVFIWRKSEIRDSFTARRPPGKLVSRRIRRLARSGRYPSGGRLLELRRLHEHRQDDGHQKQRQDVSPEVSHVVVAPE
jgi:hypothetical protein